MARKTKNVKNIFKDCVFKTTLSAQNTFPCKVNHVEDVMQPALEHNMHKVYAHI